MSIFIDLLLIAVFVVFVVIFSKNGFARTAYKIGKTWLSVFCSIILGPWLAGKLETLFLRQAITDGINGTLTNLVENNPNGYNLAQLFENLPSGFAAFLNNYKVNLADLEAEYGSHTVASAEIIQAISERMATPCVQAVSSIIGHIVCFLVPLLIFVWLNNRIRSRKYAFFRYVDYVTGFLVGAISGYCAAFAIAVLVSTVFQLILCFDASSPVAGIYTNSYVLKFLNEFNTVEFVKNTFISLAANFT